MSEIERSLLIEDAAEALGLSRRTVYYRIREGKLRTIRTRCGSQRVLLSSIEALLDEMRGVPPSSSVISPGAAV
jgi:excisionase family DNA binding protein